MAVFDHMTAHDYERVVFCNDPASGLRAIIAIHDTTLGPALGGVRMRPYPTEEEALVDALRLARGMTYKAAISGVDCGGGKSVIIGDAGTDKTETLLRAFGGFVKGLAGGYVCGQDIGTDSHDMAVIRGMTPHVACVNESAGGAGDPSHVTAYGVTCGIRAVLDAATGSPDMDGRHVVVQGLGNVGYSVARFCREAGARVTASDVVESLVDRAVEELGVESVPADRVYDVECDVFSPNSIGAVVNDDTIPRLRCRAVAGGANNVLAELRHGDALGERDIVYGPDYLVNSGGLIRCQEEVRGAPTDDPTIFAKVDQIYHQTLEVIRVARERGISTARAADRMAEERIEAARA